MILFLEESTVLAIYNDQIDKYGGAHGIRDAAALDAALHMPQAQFSGQFLHQSIFHMAAAYGFHICQNHPFFDGNKRTAGMAMLTFLLVNGLEPTASEDDYYQVMMDVASGNKSKEQLAEWLRTSTKGIPPEIE